MKTLEHYYDHYINSLHLTDPEEALEAVKQNGYALQYVKNQTEKICLEAVKQNGYALKYVTDQTEEICLEAIKQDKEAVIFIKEKIWEQLINNMSSELRLTSPSKYIREMK